MLNYPKQASFYTRSTTYSDYGEEVYTAILAFSTGARMATLSFSEALKAKGTVDTSKFYIYTRKNTNTLAVLVGDYVKVDGITLEVIGIDPKYGNRAEIMFFMDVIVEPVV
tara:strand:- start:3281 stop:3613 length:333 start_codon:yes stop_codon:yes gene_type:complete